MGLWQRAKGSLKFDMIPSNFAHVHLTVGAKADYILP
jgi:hypothetical protein